MMWRIRFLLLGIVLVLGWSGIGLSRAETGVVSLTLAQVITDSTSKSGHRVTAIVSFVGPITGDMETDALTKKLIGLLGGRADADYGYSETIPLSVLKVLELYRKEQPGVPICVVTIESKGYQLICLDGRGKTEEYISFETPEAALEVMRRLPRRVDVL